jgi:AraC-like DNA-binding protein
MQPLHKAMFWRDPDIEGLEICLVKRSGHAFPNHCHNYYAIGLMEEGASYCLGRRRNDSLILPGQIALINPGQIHSGVPPQGVRPTYRMFYIPLALVRQAALDIYGQEVSYPEFTSQVVSTPQVAGALRRLHSLVAQGGERIAKDTAMVWALFCLLTQYGEPKPVYRGPEREHHAVTAAKDYLRANPDHRVSLQELAQIAGLSRYHFLRVFKRATGMSPYAYHIQKRIERAKRLLIAGLPISEVALEAGFVDQSHFSHKFKQIVGATPGQYISC